MEAQGYRDSQASTTNTKSTQSKKKSPQQESQNYYEIINRDCCGALATLSKKAVEASAAHIKNTSFIYVTQKEPRSSIFVRPMIPKIVSRAEKNSPKKDILDEAKDSPSPQKESTSKNVSGEIVNDSEKETKKLPQDIKDKLTQDSKEKLSQESKEKLSQDTKEKLPQNTKENSNTEQSTSNSNVNETIKTSLNIPAVVPIKFRRQSLDLIKNPIINKNITDFKKAGMKTKILVIKPINRNKDGTPVSNTPLKFQTIKLKDPSKCSSSNEEKLSDQVMVVKVPKVETISRTVTDPNIINNGKITPVIANTLNNNNVPSTVGQQEINPNENKETVSSTNENLSIETKCTLTENKAADEDSNPVSDTKELNTDKETVENVSDAT